MKELSSISQLVHQNNCIFHRLVYLIAEDQTLANELKFYLEQANYRVIYLERISEINKAIKIEKPTAVILETHLKDMSNLGVDVNSKRNHKSDNYPPMIYISEHGDTNDDVIDVEIGTSYYFTKPLDKQKILSTLQKLECYLVNTSYRVLIIDDDEAILESYSDVLRAAGIFVKTLVNPLDCLSTISEFEPNIILMEMNMPQCSGPGLVQLIKQDQARALIPIIFMSANVHEFDLTALMHLGADDFLEKPISYNKLVAKVSILAKRARLNKQIQTNLSNALRENQFYLSTMDQHNIVSTTDVKGTITSVNDKFCEISGYCRDELIGNNHRMLKSGQHPAKFYKELWDIISRGNIWHGVICNRKKNGEEYWVESTIVPFLNDEGQPYKYVSARTDITALMESEDRLRRSQNFANIGTWDWNIKTGKLFWSSRIGELFGYGTQVPETTYENFMAAVHPDDRLLVSDAIAQCIEHGREYNLEHRVIWNDGSIHWMHESGDVTRAEDGTALHMLGVVQDITKRKASDAALKESEEKYRLLFELSDDPMWIILDNHIIMANNAASNILGYDSYYKLINIHPSKLSPKNQSDGQDSFDKFEKMISKVLNDGFLRSEWDLQNENCKEIPFEISLTRIPYQGKNAIYCVLRDITQRKMSERSLIIAREEAEKASQAKTQFLSSMSHELRTPMNAILGFSQLLKIDHNKSLNEYQKDSINEIYSAGEHLLELINKVLDLSKIEEGYIDLKTENVSVSDVVFESLQLIGPLAKERNIQITLERQGVHISIDQLSEQIATVNADRTRLKQILINLLSNAVKYNVDNGQITISCKHTENGKTRICISDTGEGLTKEQQTQLFKPFSRIDAKQTEIEGIGIGLVITKKIVEVMGGKIGMDSKPGVGSTFWFELPGSTIHQTHNVIANTVNQTVEKNKNVKDTVLYIEDNLVNYRLVEKTLSHNANIQFLGASEGELGFELATENIPRLILLDINLPGMSGYDVLKKLKQQKSTAHIPVFAVSAKALPADIKYGLELGFDNYITKPIDIKVLINSVEEELSTNTNE